jgi:hypothetical protein
MGLLLSVIVAEMMLECRGWKDRFGMTLKTRSTAAEAGVVFNKKCLH